MVTVDSINNVTERAEPYQIKRAKLTIAIPTRNRIESLKKVVNEVCLRVLEAEAGSDIQILVVDDWSSPDETELYVQSSIHKHSFLSYYRCEKNIGLDKTLLKCIELAQSRFVWIINDHSSILPGVLTEILKYLHGDFWYIFAPGKGELEIAKNVAAICRQGPAFINTVINTNIFNKDHYVAYYKKNLPEYDGSWLVFQVSNLDMLFGNPQAQVLLLPFECTEYGKFMDASRQKNTWNSNWETYVRVGFNGAKLLADIKNKYHLTDSLYKSIYNRRDWGLEACKAYVNLRKNGGKIDRRIAEVIKGHPTYNTIEEVIIMGALTAEKKRLIIYQSLLFLYSIYLFKFIYLNIIISIRQILNRSISTLRLLKSKMVFVYV